MAAAFYGGDQINASVVDVGSYATKIGWAGDIFPKSYFRSNVAVLREEKESEDVPGRHTFSSIKYDYYTRPINYTEQNDGNWETANPINSTTDLFYDPESKLSADWHELFERFVRHGYESALKSYVPEHPLLLVERAFQPPPLRQQVVECLFEELAVPAAFLAKDAVLSCYACGRTTATVVDVGYAGTTVAPVYEGYIEPKSILRSPAGLRAVDEYILEQLDQLNNKKAVMPLYQVRAPGHAMRRADIHHAARLHMALDCRETGAGACINTAPAASAATFHAPHKPYELPDGTVLDLPSSLRFSAAEIIFGTTEASQKRRDELLERKIKDYVRLKEEASQEPSDEEIYNLFSDVGMTRKKTARKSNSTSASTTFKKPPFSNKHLLKACSKYLDTEVFTSSPLASMVCDAAYKCERDQQAALLGNVIVGGGGTCIGPTETAVPDLLREQIEATIHAHTPGWRVKVMTPGWQERSVLNWLGGSILGSLGTFHDMWITKAQYEEEGPGIVNRKCP